MTAGLPSEPRPASGDPAGDPASDPRGDAARMREISDRLAVAIAEDFGPWVESTVAERYPPVAGAARELADGLEARVVPAVRDLLASDIDTQATTPLDLLRHAGSGIAEFLLAAGAPEEALVPEIGPMNFAELSPRVGEVGLEWGAAKAHLHLVRRRS